MATEKQLKALAKARRARAKNLREAKQTARAKSQKAKAARSNAKRAVSKAKKATKTAAKANARVMWLIAATEDGKTPKQFYNGDSFENGRSRAALYTKSNMQKVAAGLAKRLPAGWGLMGESCTVK